MREPTHDGRRFKRSIDVARAVLNGATFLNAGKQADISTERARQIMNFALRKAAFGHKDRPNETCDPIDDLRVNKDWKLALPSSAQVFHKPAALQGTIWSTHLDLA